MKKLFFIICILLIPIFCAATTTVNICFFGQSNAGQMKCVYESLTDGCGSTVANSGVIMWSGSAWITTGPTSGPNGSEGLTAMGNAINNTTGWNVRFIDLAFGSSSIFQSTTAGLGYWWNDTIDTPSTYYITQKSIFTASGLTSCDAIVIANGECEGYRIYNSSCPSNLCTSGQPASPNVWNQSWYITHSNAFWNQLRSDYGANAIIIQGQLATSNANGNSNGFDSSWSNVREYNKAAIAAFGGASSHAYIGDTTVNFALSLNLQGLGMHWLDTSYAAAGKMLAQTFLYDKGYVSWYKGPIITGLNAVDSTHTDILVQHSGGTDFTPATGIGGFAETCGGSALTISAAVRQTATSIRLTHGACSSTRIATYMYGVAPLTYGTGNFGTPVTDNSTLSYPLEPNINITQIAGTTYTISGTISGAVQSGVTITLTGAASASTTTASDGTYNYGIIGR